MESLLMKLPLRPASGKDAASFANTGKLCPQCSDALSRRFQQPRVQIRDGDWRTPSRFEIERASQSVWSMGHLRTSRTACPFCQYLHAVTERNPALSGRELDDDEQLLLVPYKAGITHFESTTSQIMWRWRIGARTRDAPVAWPMGSVYPLIEGEPKVTDPEGERIFHGRNTGPLIGWETVRRWHAWCVEHHTRAYPHTFAAEPEQFLTCDHVSQPSDMTCCVFRLVDVHRHCIVPVSSKPRYAALSYVWGDTPRFLLHRSNISELRAVNSLERLIGDVPKTFLDSMEVTRQLGLNFLWIDALCIIQDDKEDVDSHLSNMHIIYNNAELTIVSSGANASTGLPGCQGLPRPQTQVEFKFGDISLINTNPGFAEAVSNSSWECRGWTFQEKIFSRRMLVFTDLQVFWRCQEATWFEDTIMEPWEDKSKLLRLGEMSYPGSKRGPSPLQLTYGIHAPPSRRRYQELVAAYIPRQLSFPEDILNAFRGVLKLYGSGGSEDLWGLPGADLAGAIAWYYDQDEPSKRRLGFPSWSWAGWVASPGNGIRFREMPARHSPFEPTYHRFIDNEWKSLESHNSSPWGIGEEGTKLGYDIPHHPGGSKYTKRELPPFEYRPSTMPPLSHLFRFWTSSAMLEISPTPISTDYRQHQYNVSLPGTRDRLTWIILDADWVGQNPGPGEFIVISPGVEMLGEKLIDDVDVGLNLLLIERRFEVAYRLQLCGSLVQPKLWKKAMPCWKDITLG